jgi:cytochrome c
MKQILFSALMMLLLVSCGSSESENQTTSSASTPNTNPDYQKGIALVSKSNCFTCHKIEEKVVGPSYRDIANKYASQSDAVAMLGEKIIKGGSGVWGTVPMLPHPELSKDDAESMAKYILLLKK